MELDTLLPADVPGYGTAPDVSILTRIHPEYAPFDINYDSISLSPALNAAAGYDSNPNGIGGGSATLNFNPSLFALDTQLGFGGYAAGAFARYPQVPDQNRSDYTVALGERAVLPRDTLTLSLASLRTDETGFGFNTVAINRPIRATVQDMRGSDTLVLGMLALTPEFSFSRYAFANYSSQNRTDYRQSIAGEFSSGGPARVVAAVHATESQYSQHIFNAGTYAALAGIADQADGLWQIRMLAGVATRQPATGKAINAPVLETSLSWMPSEIDSISLDLVREIDDPDQESAEGYTLSQGDLSIAHEYLRNVVITGSLKAGRAVYFDSPLAETLFNVLSGINWHLNRSLAIDAAYAFNDRQSNRLRAANEHIITMGVTWTP